MVEAKNGEQFKNYTRQLSQIRATSRRFEEAKTLYLQKYLGAHETIERYEQQVVDIYNSHSWRITAPLRWIGNQVRLLRMHGIRKRLVAFWKKITLFEE